MTSVTITVNVPESVDPRDYQERVASALGGLSRRAIEDVRDKELCRQALESDNGLEKWAKVRMVTVPFIRAGWYRKVEPDQEFRDFSTPLRPSCEDRRPVVMRGALDRLIWMHGYSKSHCANGWCVKVAKRYLRKIKFTSFDWRKTRDMGDRIASNLRKKHFLSYHFDDHLDSMLEWTWHNSRHEHIWFNGRARTGELSAQQIRYIKLLHGIVKKTDRLDKRMDALREHRRNNGYADAA